MALGPVDVFIIGIPGTQFTGRVAPAVLELIDGGTIRIIDMLIVVKDADGTISSFETEEIKEFAGPSFAEIEIAQPGALGHDDANEISDDLENNSSALLIAFENVWARKLSSALQAADATVIDYIRIPADVAQAVIAE